MSPSRRAFGFASLAMGVCLSAWISWTHNIWGPYGLVRLAGPLVFVALLPALLGIVGSSIILVSGSRAESHPDDDSDPKSTEEEPSSSWAWAFVFVVFVLPGVAVLLALVLERL